MTIETPESGSCVHAWERLPKWTARYKCVVCGALGYRGIVTVTPPAELVPPGAALVRPAKYAQILPYRCNKSVIRNGKKTTCQAPAVVRKANTNRCWGHREDWP